MQVRQTHDAHVYLNISNLPLYTSGVLVRQRVEQIMENCGGKMIHQQGGRGLIKFTTPESAQRYTYIINSQVKTTKKNVFNRQEMKETYAILSDPPQVN